MVRAIVIVVGIALGACNKTASKDGCSKDTDCKGDRVCSNKTCVDVPANEAPASVPPRVPSAREREMFSANKEDIARLTVKKYAYEAYPAWSTANPSKLCPDRLDQLNEFMNNKDVKDPWGTPYTMLCGSSLPAGARGLQVVSAGPDAKQGTADDIKSWE